MRTSLWTIAVASALAIVGYLLYAQTRITTDAAVPVHQPESAYTTRAPSDPRAQINIDQAPDESPRDLVEDFIALLQSGDYREAVALYEVAEDGDIIRLNHLKNAYSSHLQQLSKAEDYESVVALAREFLNDYYNDFTSLVYLAAACSQLGDFRCTIDAYYAAILYGTDAKQSKVATSTLRLFLSKTDALWSKAQHWQELTRVYEHALQWQPDNAEYHLRLAEIYLQLGDFVSAQNMLAAVTPSPELQQRIAAVEQAIAQQSTGNDGIPLRKRGSHYLVDVVINGMPVSLMIDTGASVSALSRDAVEQVIDAVGLQFQGQTRLATAGGTIESQVYLADTVAIDKHELYGVEWVVIDMPGSGVDGVLGMNILSQFEFQLDQQRQLLTLEDR